MLVLECHIEISGTKIVKFDYVSNIEINSSLKSLTDTATVTVPRKLKFGDKSLTDFIRRGDAVTIRMGYKGHTVETVFKGYVNSIKSASPIVIECEDEAWKLKQITVKNLYYDNFSIADFIKKYCPDLESDIDDIYIGELRINGEFTIAGILAYLSEKFPTIFFFRDKKLYCRKISNIIIDNQHIVTITNGSNIISDTLKYTLAEDVKVAVTAKTVTRDNVLLEYTEPQEAEGSEVHTYYYPAAASVAQLKEYASEQLKNYKVNRMQGDVILFGVPFVCPGDTVKIMDTKNTERNGKKFLCDSVKYSFGVGGYRQTVRLGNEI